jgi:ATP-dependent Clp protease adaptor protein ClpS
LAELETPTLEPASSEGIRSVPPARTVLYNDDWHTFEDVTLQLVKAIHCSAEEGERHAWIVHTEGRSVVFQGAREECERVAGVLREIRLQVEVDWD